MVSKCCFFFFLQSDNNHGFVGWVDPPMCERAVRIIPGLLRAKNLADQERNELRAEIRRKNFMILLLVIVLGLQFAVILSL